jgi:outer membrane receptor protein involved in Fe transport
MGLYGTLESRLGKLTALAGLRLEQGALDLAQVTTGERTVYDYFRVYPTLHLSYALTEREQLRASYSRRIQRPQGQDLNPFREYRDPFNFRAGNPLLRPQVTDSLEAGWQRREGTTFYQGTLYYRHTSDAFTDIIQELGGGVLLTSRANLGSSRNAGAELIANRRLGSKLTLNASVNGAWNEIDAGNLGFFRRRSAAQFSGRGSLNWRPTAKDQVQLSGFLSGRTLRPQGYRGASGMISLGYRHQFTDALSFVATARDLLDNFGETIVYDTPEFRDRAERKFGGRIIFVGFSYTFGGNKGNRRDPSFDFEGGRTE